MADDEDITQTLVRALSQSQTLVKQLAQHEKTIQHLFTQLAGKDTEIRQLKKELRPIQAKDRKWRLQNPAIASPIVTSHEIEPSSRPSTPRDASPTPHVQVSSSPPRKRRRTETTPLREVQNNTAVSRSMDRVQKMVAAIPMLAEDGEEAPTAHQTPKSPKMDAASRKAAFGRLGALLGAPADHADEPKRLERPQRTESTSPKASTTIPALRKSSSDVVQEANPPPRRKPRFLPPKPQQKQLREQPMSEIALTDFKLNPEYVEMWDYPGGQQRKSLAAVLGQTISDEDLLREFLGTESTIIPTLTKTARDNLLHEARAKKIADGFAQSKLDKEPSGPLQTTYWTTGFPPSQEEERNRLETVARVKEEIARRYAEAVDGGRWLFRDE